MLLRSDLLLALWIFFALEYSNVFSNAIMSSEFDLPSPGETFKTLPPEGPPETTLNDETDGRGTFTSPLIAPSDNQRSATSSVWYPNGSPGDNQDVGHTVGSPVASPEDPRPYPENKVCQYVFTVEDAGECTETVKEIAVHHVFKAMLPSKDAFGQISNRLTTLEKAVLRPPPGSPGNELQRDVPGIFEVDLRSEEYEGMNETEEDPKTIPQSLLKMAQDLVEQVTALERGIKKSERERQELRSLNRILKSSLRRSAAGRRSESVLRTSLEENLRAVREENSRLAIANRTLSLQTRALRSQRLRLQTVQENLRAKLRALEVENQETKGSALKSQQQLSECTENSYRLKDQVRNVTSDLERYMKISYEDESLQYELEKEREKNEALIVENAEFKAEIENATKRIDQLVEEFRIARGPKLSNPPDSWREQDHSDCGKIISISPPETIRAPQSYLEKYGVWMMDPLEALGDGKVWSMNTFRDKAKEMKQYGSLQKFALNQHESVITLPVSVENNGGVVYNGSFYYQRRNSRKIVRFDLSLKRILNERAVHRAGFHATFAYRWGGLTDIDMAVDELGLWVIFSTSRNNGNIVVSRLDPVSLQQLFTAKTSIPKRSVANAFMACGVLYTLDSFDSANASLNYQFDTIRRRSRRISIPFANQHRLNVMVDYNPNTREIFSWDHSYQVKYYVTLDKSFGPISDIPLRGGRRRRG